MIKQNIITIIISFILLLSGTTARSQHIEEVSHVSFGIKGNDCWGYIDSSGTEYAIMGLQDKAVIYSLEDPSHPRLMGEFPGSSSIWRDIKSWGDRIYVVTEARDGILIINMSDTSNISSHFFIPEVPLNGSTTQALSSHNIYIDEHGIAYLAGTKVGVGGVVMFDLKPDPDHPTFVGIENNAYAHDVVTQRDTMFTSDIYAGELRIWDVHDKANPQFLGSHATTSNFTHNAWPSTDGKYVFTTDERPEGRLDAYDISDLTNIKRIDTYKSRDGMARGVIPHNTHYLDGFLVTSWYSDGVIIIDAHRPDNLVEVGRFATYHGNQAGFNGCWGTFPFFPSGLIVASDRGEGLYVLRPEYQRASYLEGKITDKKSAAPIQSVTVHIKADQDNFEQSNIEGVYKTGIADSGTYTVAFTHPDYLPVTIENVTLSHGEITTLDIQMERLSEISFSGKVIDQVTKEPVPDAWVLLSSPSRNVNAQTDDSGHFAISIIASNNDALNISAGKWGYLHHQITPANGQQSVTIPLSVGYQDDFAGEQNWDVIANATTGNWERAVPVSFKTGGPVSDVEGDIGTSCYLTGNKGKEVGDDDIDNGTTSLTSPSMDLSGYKNPVIQIKYWFANFGGGGQPANDSLLFNLIEGKNKIRVAGITLSDDAWKPLRIDVRSFAQGDLKDIKLQVVAGDYDPGHVVEAGIDAFVVKDSIGTATTGLKPYHGITLYPNPARNKIALRGLPAGINSFEVRITDPKGSTWYEMVDVSSEKLKAGLDITPLSSGLYFLQLKSTQKENSTLTFVKE